jgi:uncharacterized small protein (DUF1192 family)
MGSFNVSDDYIPPNFLTDEARDLNDRFYLILTNVVAAFPYNKSNPNDLNMEGKKTNKQDYDDSMADMLQLQNDYFMYKNSVIYASELLLKKVNAIDDKINVLDTEITELKAQLKNIVASSRSAEGMLDDSQMTRNQIFCGNIVLFLFMATSGYVYYKKVLNA